jgi:cyclin-dependent kinase 7
VFFRKENIYLVYELLDSDLSEIIKDKDILLSSSHIKAYMKMILEGVKELHVKFLSNLIRVIGFYTEFF